VAAANQTPKCLRLVFGVVKIGAIPALSDRLRRLNGCFFRQAKTIHTTQNFTKCNIPAVFIAGMALAKLDDEIARI
jgi:hypothetical protein